MDTRTIGTRAGLALAVLAVTVAGWVGPEAAEARNVRATTRTNVNRNVNVNRDVNRNVNVNRDVDIDVDRDWNHHYHPVARAAAVTATVAVTAAVVGSMVYALPPACSAVVVNGFTYQNCGGTWYQPQYAGTSITYVVVNPPQ
jgi:hypothetical protein